jgi:hypothetical protein
MDALALTKEYTFHFADLMSPIDIAEDFTVGDLCTLLQNLPTADSKTLSHVVQCPLILFIDECLNPEHTARATDLHYIRLTWECVYSDKEQFGDRWTHLGLNVDAIGDVWEDYRPGGQCYKEGEDYSECNRWGISFSKMYELRELPIRLNPIMEVRKEFTTAESVSLSSPPLTLLDLIYAFFWEMSFFGTPDKRDERLAEMQGQMEDIRKELHEHKDQEST